jgi:hypothetical protein
MLQNVVSEAKVPGTFSLAFGWHYGIARISSAFFQAMLLLSYTGGTWHRADCKCRQLIGVFSPASEYEG